jgi:hypothetical protein
MPGFGVWFFFVDEAGVLLGFVLFERGYFDFAQYMFYRCPAGKRGLARISTYPGRFQLLAQAGVSPLRVLMTSFCETLLWVYLCSRAHGNHGVVKRLL